jgi:hypothetical protein
LSKTLQHSATNDYQLIANQIGNCVNKNDSYFVFSLACPRDRRAFSATHELGHMHNIKRVVIAAVALWRV